jgi:c-di-GMP-binding flagellar brake protein YcgR
MKGAFMAWEGLNRRKFPRVQYPCLIKISSEANGVSAFLAHTENLSIGGVGVIIRTGFKHLSLVDFELDLMDDGDHIACTGKVVWSVRRKATETFKASFYDTGIEFVNMKSEDARRVTRVVDHLSSREMKGKI